MEVLVSDLNRKRGSSDVFVDFLTQFRQIISRAFSFLRGANDILAVLGCVIPEQRKFQIKDSTKVVHTTN